MAKTDSPVWAVVPVAASGLIFGGITRNYFVGDDFLHLFWVVDDGWIRFVWQVFFGHLLIVRNAVFAFHHAVFGVNPVGYFATVLGNHLLNVLMLFELIRRLTGSAAFGCAGATVWGTSPTHEGTLGWYSVYGHVIATTGMLAALLLLCSQASARKILTPARVAPWAGLLLLGAASFGTGIAVAIVFPLVAILLWESGQRRPGAVPSLLAIPVGIGAVYVAVRTFGPRLPGNEPVPGQVLPLGYRELTTIVAMTWHLLAAGTTALIVGVGAFLPSYSPAVNSFAGVSLLLASTWFLRQRSGPDRRRLLCFMLIPISCYGMIALGRVHFILGLHDTRHVPVAPFAAVGRYHYMALAGVTLWMCVLARSLRHRSTRTEWLLAGVIVGSTILSWWVRGAAIDHHELERRQTEKVVMRLEREIAAHPPGSIACLENRPFLPMYYLKRDPWLRFPGEAAVFMVFLDGNNEVRGRRVIFTEQTPAILQEAPEGSRLRELLAPNCPPGRL